MPKFTSRDITVALDMCGCPNRCRHCWLGRADNRRMTERDLRWAVERFRTFVRKGQTEPFFTGVKASASWREPDFSDDYQRLRDLECELSDGEPWRFELLSVWRLARDETYARWARTVGPDTCQITFFGLEQTTDWFCRRRGAFRDGIIATQRLLDAGIKPRWQFFLTRKILPDLPGLLKLVETLKLPERAAALGGEFTLFMHTPGPSGQARHIEHLRPTIDQIADLPAEIVEPTRQHFKRDRLWFTEGELAAQILDGEERFPWGCHKPEHLWFIIAGNWDVFTNWATTEPWWRLGNLQADPLETIIANYEYNQPLGYRTVHTLSIKEAARRYGDPNGQRVYEGGVEELWLGQHSEAEWANPESPPDQPP
ncbi:MAG: radical SAM protein [Phycisphaerae bacterium]|nr:radical SAM protein [Phycisphaerae bacterium]